MTEGEWVSIVSENGMDLRLCAFDQTERICLTAVRQNGLALVFVNKEFQTSKILLEAFKQNHHSVHFVK